MTAGMNIEIPIWLILFVFAGLLLFVLKILSEDRLGEHKLSSNSLKLFLLIATVLFTVAGVIDFMTWVRRSY
jgi:hypothetical protein